MDYQNRLMNKNNSGSSYTMVGQNGFLKPADEQFQPQQIWGLTHHDGLGRIVEVGGRIFSVSIDLAPHTP
jgi:predicted flavoprotein YhiN